MARLIRIKMPELLDRVLNSKRAGIIGVPGVGKTTLSECIDGGKMVIHTDEFLQTHNHEDRPDGIMLRLAMVGPCVVEGNEVTRLVNRGVKFDLLILVDGPTAKTDKSMNGLRGRLEKFLGEYRGDIYVINPREG